MCHELSCTMQTTLQACNAAVLPKEARCRGVRHHQRALFEHVSVTHLATKPRTKPSAAFWTKVAATAAWPETWAAITPETAVAAIRGKAAAFARSKAPATLAPEPTAAHAAAKAAAKALQIVVCDSCDLLSCVRYSRTARRCE